MLRRIREPFGKAGLIVAVVALVAALVGGAYAANGLTGKQKKEVKKIAKRFAGKNGESGAAGQVGAQGPKGNTGTSGITGATGATGETGKDGKNGESVTIVPLLPNEDPECPNGGTKFSNHQVFSYACSGGGGDGEYPETLPPGRTMTGYWEILGDRAIQIPAGPENWPITTISFPLPLADPPTETVLLPVSLSDATEEQKTKCPGTSSDPKATAGVLCLYPLFAVSLTLLAGAPETFGAQLIFSENAEAIGSWAVQAPPAP